MGKYAPLREFLAAQTADTVSVTFVELEALLGIALPGSKRHPAWWSNNPSNNPMTREWLAAGFRTEGVSTVGERLTFRRAVRQGSAETAVQEAGRLVHPPPGFHPLFGCMRGLGRAAHGVDLTEPPDKGLADFLDTEYGPEAGRPAA